MPFHQHNNLRYYSFESLSGEVTQGIFTRRGGVSSAPWDSLNVGSTVGDDAAHVRENRARLFAALDRPAASIFDAWLVHSDDVLSADSPRGADEPPMKADIILTDKPSVSLFLRFADCVPIFFHDPQRRVVGLAHAGWLGTVRGAARAAIEKMRSRYGCNAADIRACIGPSIGPDHYEIGADVEARVRQAFGNQAEHLLAWRDGVTYFDLWKANRIQLQAMGVREIEVSGVCTACGLDDWFSHRAERGKTGRFGALIALRA